MEIDEPANIYVLREPFHRRRPPWRPHKSFSNQVQEYWDRLQKEFFREWYRGHCPSPIQLEMLYSRLLFARPVIMLMTMMKLFNGGIQHDKSIHLIIRYWNDFHSETSSIMFLYVGFTWCRNDISFAAQVIPVRFWIGMKFGKSVWNFIVVSCKLKANFVSDWQYISCKELRNIVEKAFLSLSATSGRKLTNLMANAGTSVIYCKTVGFFS